MTFNIFQYIGIKFLNLIKEIGEISLLFLNILKNFKQIPNSRKLIFEQMEKIGVNSLPLVLIIAIFTGAVSAWQAAYQLKGIAPLSLLGGATSKAIITELIPVLTGIVIAGRVGASIAAEIGTMKVTEQIDALEIMAVDPNRFLAMPRFIATILLMPILTIYADVIGIAGSYIVSNYFLDISFNTFFNSVKMFFSFSDFLSGLVKTVFFGGVTALIGCHIGFKTSNGAEGVGKSTIRSFVLTATLILILDYLLWMFLF